ERAQQIGDARSLGLRPPRRWQERRIVEQPCALRLRQPLDEPPRAQGRLNRRAFGESARLQREVDQMFSFAVGHAPIALGLHACDVRSECRCRDPVRGQGPLQHVRQVAVLDSTTAIAGRSRQFERRDDTQRDENPQNSSLRPSCPYRGKFDCRTTLRSIEPKSAFVALFSYCRSSYTTWFSTLNSSTRSCRRTLLAICVVFAKLMSN